MEYKPDKLTTRLSVVVACGPAILGLVMLFFSLSSVVIVIDVVLLIITICWLKIIAQDVCASLVVNKFFAYLIIESGDNYRILWDDIAEVYFFETGIWIFKTPWVTFVAKNDEDNSICMKMSLLSPRDKRDLLIRSKTLAHLNGIETNYEIEED